MRKEDSYEMLGLECDLNRLVSPYTYVTKERTIVFEAGAVNLYRDILRLNPEQMLELRDQARARI